MTEVVPVSVVIPCYGCAQTVERAVASVAAQTVQPMELILVDDGSADGTRAVLNELRGRYAPGWIQLVLLDKNQGAASARNAGWEQASGHYIALLDADDSWHPRKIELQYRFMASRPDIAVSGHGYEQVDVVPAPAVLDDAVFQQLRVLPVLLKNPFVTPSFMFRRDLPHRFFSGKRHMEDHLFLMQVATSGLVIAKTSLPLAYIYKNMFGDSGLSADLWAMQRSELVNYAILYRERRIPYLGAVFLTDYSWVKFSRRLFLVGLRKLFRLTGLAKTRASSGFTSGKDSPLPEPATSVAPQERVEPIVWGLVVCFQPTAGPLLDLVRRLAEQVTRVLLLNNGGLNEDVRSQLLSIKTVIIFDFEKNSGVAVALNEGFRQAVADQADFVVTFDQDSSPEAGHVAGLMHQWFALSSAAGLGQKTGAIGPSFYDGRNGHFDFPFYREEGWKVVKEYFAAEKSLVRADVLITSGMLVPTSMWADDLKFNELLFIDFVDTEWCLRSRKSGYSHYGCFDVKMKHELSEAGPVMWFGFTILKYSPLRRYYYFRNCLYCVSRSYVPNAFKVRLMIGLLLRVLTLPMVDEKPYLSIKSVAAGIFDALRGRYGSRKL
ncbi:glycosyltransferase [Polaromonas sp.]|uniref:glycosyltransferase n=1 Tax=Polaromonas sp. TaxID=1869339 RepID=UPI003565C186